MTQNDKIFSNTFEFPSSAQVLYQNLGLHLKEKENIDEYIKVILEILQEFESKEYC